MTPSRSKEVQIFLALTASSAFLLAGGASRAADKVDKKECVAAYEEGQRLRKESKLSDARTRLLVCAQETCPVVVRRDCTQWVADIEQSTPTLVLEALGGGDHDLFDVRVSVDGKSLVTRLDGKAISVDPGVHIIRFERPGSPAIEERVLAREGEKNRRIVARFGNIGEGPTGTTPAAAPPAAPQRLSTPSSVYILGGVGLLGIGTFGYFGALGLSAKSELDKRGCKPSCPAPDVESMKRRFIVADVGLGVGIVAAGIATIIFVTRESSGPSARDTSWKFDLAPTVGGAHAAFGTAF
jgi:hypothetical protein